MTRKLPAIDDRKASERYARKLGLTEIHVHFGTFDFAFNCIVGPWKGVVDYVAWKFEAPDDAYLTELIELSNRGHEPLGKVFRRPGYCPIIWIPRRPRTPQEHGTLAHEVFHAVRLLMDWAGIHLNEDTEEAYCHALGFGVRQVLTHLKR